MNVKEVKQKGERSVTVSCPKCNAKHTYIIIGTGQQTFVCRNGLGRFQKDVK